MTDDMIGFRIFVESDSGIVMDYFVPTDHFPEAHRRVCAYLHSSRRGVQLPRYLEPKMGNIPYRVMKAGIRF